MLSHKFPAGTQVEFMPGPMDRHVPRGIYTIVRSLPVGGDGRQYRVRNAQDGHERVVNEAQLRAAEQRHKAAAEAAFKRA